MFGAMRLKLYHQVGSQPGNVLQLLGERTQAFHWQTCLRSLALVPDDIVLPVPTLAAKPPGEWLDGEAAYRRLLEIICGLHSPLIGETEVFGQFKDAIQDRLSAETHDTAFTSTLRAWARALIEDVKLVRQKHLLDLGSQSYGSLVRREVREFRRPQIEFLGSGKLAIEVMPWILKAMKKEAQIVVHARNLESARERIGFVTDEAISFSELSKGPAPSQPESQRILIVAAPMTSVEICKWAQDANFDLVIDLRGEGRHDSLKEMILRRQTKSLRSLDEVFSSIELARSQADEKKSAALALIDQCVEARLLAATHRPFGWDDVWS